MSDNDSMDKDVYIKQMEARIVELEKRIEELEPEVCPCGGTAFETTDEEPLRHQIVDIPPIESRVIEYVQHIRRCRDCGELLYQPLPDEVKRKYFGPGVLALVAILTGMLNTSKRKALAMINEVFSVQRFFWFMPGEAKGAMAKMGQELYGLAKKILKLRKRVRDGTLQWRTFQNRMQPLMDRVEYLLAEGACGQGKMSRKCRRIIKHREHLWTFVQDRSVEPTNNIAERIVRQSVLWRKSSFGTQSERGARYVERILTTCATCRLQRRSVIEYLRDACRCHLDHVPAPSLVNSRDHLLKSA